MRSALARGLEHCGTNIFVELEEGDGWMQPISFAVFRWTPVTQISSGRLGEAS